MGHLSHSGVSRGPKGRWAWIVGGSSSRRGGKGSGVCRHRAVVRPPPSLLPSPRTPTAPTPAPAQPASSALPAPAHPDSAANARRAFPAHSVLPVQTRTRSSPLRTTTAGAVAAAVEGTRRSTAVRARAAALGAVALAADEAAAAGAVAAGAGARVPRSVAGPLAAESVERARRRPARRRETGR